MYEIYVEKEGISDSKEIVYTEPTDSSYIGSIQSS